MSHSKRPQSISRSKLRQLLKFVVFVLFCYVLFVVTFLSNCGDAHHDNAALGRYRLQITLSKPGCFQKSKQCLQIGVK